MALHHVPPLTYPDPDRVSEGERKPYIAELPTKTARKPQRWALGLAFLLVIGAWFAFNEYKDRLRLREASTQGSRLMEQVKFEEVSLSNLSGWSRISGRVRNTSGYTLTGADLTVTIQDCVHNSCETVGQNSLSVNDLTVPPRQSRAFERYLTFKGLPPPRGQYQWRYNVERLRGY